MKKLESWEYLLLFFFGNNSQSIRQFDWKKYGGPLRHFSYCLQYVWEMTVQLRCSLWPYPFLSLCPRTCFWWQLPQTTCPRNMLSNYWGTVGRGLKWTPTVSELRQNRVKFGFQFSLNKHSLLNLLWGTLCILNQFVSHF